VRALWEYAAGKLTNFENHPRQRDHEASLAIKTFALNFVAAYGNLLLTSYVYVRPLALSRLVPEGSPAPRTSH